MEYQSCRRDWERMVLLLLCMFHAGNQCFNLFFRCPQSCFIKFYIKPFFHLCAFALFFKVPECMPNPTAVCGKERPSCRTGHMYSGKFSQLAQTYTTRPDYQESFGHRPTHHLQGLYFRHISTVYLLLSMVYDRIVIPGIRLNCFDFSDIVPILRRIISAILLVFPPQE